MKTYLKWETVFFLKKVKFNIKLKKYVKEPLFNIKSRSTSIISAAPPNSAVQQEIS